jgi:hypothetical protein
MGGSAATSAVHAHATSERLVRRNRKGVAGMRERLETSSQGQCPASSTCWPRDKHSTHRSQPRIPRTHSSGLSTGLPRAKYLMVGKPRTPNLVPNGLLFSASAFTCATGLGFSLVFLGLSSAPGCVASVLGPRVLRSNGLGIQGFMA